MCVANVQPARSRMVDTYLTYVPVACIFFVLELAPPTRRDLIGDLVAGYSDCAPPIPAPLLHCIVRRGTLQNWCAPTPRYLWSQLSSPSLKIRSLIECHVIYFALFFAPRPRVLKYARCQKSDLCRHSCPARTSSPASTPIFCPFFVSQGIGSFIPPTHHLLTNYLQLVSSKQLLIDCAISPCQTHPLHLLLTLSY